MIGHQQQQIEIPSRALMVNARCVREDSSCLILAKLIRSTSLTANCNEIDCAKASREMRRVIQPFTDHTRHPAIISVVAIHWVGRFTPPSLRYGAAGLNRPGD